MEKQVGQFTIATLAKGGEHLELVESWFTDNVVWLEGGSRTMSDLVDMLEEDYKQDFGTSTDSPLYRRLLAIGRRIKRETTN